MSDNLESAIRVSIIMPVWNEARFIAAALDSLIDDYVANCAEILVLDGGSSDNTAVIVKEYISRGLPLRLLENKKKMQCFALNDGIRSARGEYIVRVDGHSVYPFGYVRRLVELLESTGADNVGGVMLPVGETPFQKALALAMSHPVGVGDARFHLGDFYGYVDTVYLGAFRKNIFARIGLFDTHCRTNEDAELNIRILESGGKIYLDSSIQVEYRPRRTPRQLAFQYYHYGRGRAYTTWKHRRTTSLRQLAAPALIVYLILSMTLAILIHPIFIAAWGLYLLTTGAAACLFPAGGKKSAHSPAKVPVSTRLLIWSAFVIMHISWGLGFIRFFLFPKPKPAPEPE